MDYCSDSERVAYCTLDIYSYYVQFNVNAQKDQSWDVYLEPLKGVLFYGKVKLLKNNPSEVEMFDSYLGNIFLMQDILESKANISISLKDFTQKAKLNSIKETLVKQKVFKIAKNFALKCRLEMDTVWLAWGLDCISNHMFEKARDILKHCLGIYCNLNSY